MRLAILSFFAFALFAQTETLDRLFAERSYIEMAAALDGAVNLSAGLQAFYRGLLANRRNAAADSIANLESALPALDAPHLKVAYYILADDYSKTFRYADAASMYRQIERRFGASLARKELQDVRDALRKWDSLSRAEPQTVRIEESFTINRTRDEAGILTVPAASAAELLAAGLRDFSFFCRELPSGCVAPDPKDSYLLAMAEASQAEFLVTGDKQLLSLKRHKSTRIITPAAMVELLKKAER